MGRNESEREPSGQPEEASGGVVYRRTGGRVQVLVAEQRDRVHGHPTLRLPKGKLEPGETSRDAALREVEEETGVVGRIVGDLEEVRYAYRDERGPVRKVVRFYLMEYLSGEPRPADGEMERVFWCDPEEASRTLSFETERRVMERALSRLEGPAPHRPSA